MIFVLLFSIIFSSLSFVLGYSTIEIPYNNFLIFTFGAAWLVAVWRRWRWFHAIGLFVSLILSITGLWLGLRLDWMFSGAIFALVAWDVTDFRHKMSLLPAREDIKGMERRHLIRVGLLVLLGLGIGLSLIAWIGR